MSDGILIIDKPAGITSHDVVLRCRRILKTKKIGHTGTLDPFATGVLVILVGKATRLAQFLNKDRKEYEAIVHLGFETDTGDYTGVRKESAERKREEIETVSLEAIEKVLKDFRGEIMQKPPIYSAKKKDGKKLYELARKGIEVERMPVKIGIYELEVQTSKFNAQGLEIPIRVLCSAGTYIRVLAEDIGRKLKTGAHLKGLRRIAAGKFDISQSVSLEKLEEVASKNKLGEILISMNEAVSHLAEVQLNKEEVSKIKNGIKLPKILPESGDGDFLRLSEGANLVAIAIYDSSKNLVQPKLVLV